MRVLDQVLFHLNKIKRSISIRQMENAELSACKVVKNIFADAPALGLDLDGTIDENPEFYKILSNTWPGTVVIITCRSDENKAHEYAKSFGIYYDKLITVRKLDDKAAIIDELGINVYVDDQDECISNVPENVTILKMRNAGNFENGKWLYSNKTGEIV